MVALVQDVVLANSRPQLRFRNSTIYSCSKAAPKWLRRIHDPNRIEDYIDMGLYGRGKRPALDQRCCSAPTISLVQMLRASAAAGASLGRYPLDRTLADPDRIAEAARLACRWRCNLWFVAGGGVHLSDAATETGPSCRNAWACL